MQKFEVQTPNPSKNGSLGSLLIEHFKS